MPDRHQLLRTDLFLLSHTYVISTIPILFLEQINTKKGNLKIKRNTEGRLFGQ